MSVRRGAFALVVVLVSSFATLAAGTGAASAAPFTATGTLDCIAHAPIVGDQSASQVITINTDAPVSVLPGATFSITSQTPAGTIAASQSGGTVSSVQNVSYRIPVPANASYVSGSFSGGFNFGSGTPTLTLSGSATTGTIIFTVPGPIPAGQSYQLPAITLTFQATGAALSTIQPKLGGTSVSDPGFTTTANITSPITASVATDCWPEAPSPIWSTTTIAPPDVTPPTINLATPADGGQYPLGGSVAANYTCADGQFGSGVATCSGTVANGSPIDTAALGPHTFTVTSSDVKGNVSAPVTHTYTVVPPGNDHTPPVITFTTPADGAVYQLNAAATASYSCSDDGSGISSCTGTVANGAAINTATTGPHSFTVSATDGEGNVASVLHSYIVMPAPVQQNWSTGDVTNRMPVGCDTLLNAFHESIPVASNTAPTTAGAGSQFTWAMAIDTDVVPTLNNGTNLLYRWKKPTNGHFVSAAFTGVGSGVNGTALTINADGTLQLTIASVTDTSILGFGDDSFKPPPFQAVIQVDGAAGTVVKNMFDYFQITTTTVGLLTTTQHCPAGDTFNGRTNVPITNTTVVDSTPPIITVTSPVNGATYAPGSVVKFSYSCTDAGGTPSCVGDAPNGTNLGTSTSGTFVVHVSSTDGGGNTAARTVSYTIADPSVSVGNATVTQNPGATLDFPLTLSNASKYPISVAYATADGTATQPADYTATSGAVAFNPGDPLTKIVSVPVTAAQYFSGSRVMTLNVVSALKATIGAGSGTGTIVAAVAPAVSVADTSVTEGPGAALDFAVSLAAPPTYPVNVSVATVDGTAVALVRYSVVSGTLTFNPGGALTQHVAVPVVNNALYDEAQSPINTQTMQLTATETADGSSSSGTGTIIDDEKQPVLVSIGNVTIREGDDSHPHTVKLSITLNHPPTAPVSVGYSTITGGANGNAITNTDFKAKSGTAVFKAGVEMAYVSIPLLGDTKPDGDRFLSVKLASAQNSLIAHGTGIVTMLDDDSPTNPAVVASVSNQTLYEGGASGTKKILTTKVAFLVSLNRRPSGPVSFSYSLVGQNATVGTDFRAATGTVSFSATQTARTVVVIVIGDDNFEPDETFQLVLTPTAGGATVVPNTGFATILNDDPAP